MILNGFEEPLDSAAVSFADKSELAVAAAAVFAVVDVETVLLTVVAVVTKEAVEA